MPSKNAELRKGRVPRVGWASLGQGDDISRRDGAYDEMPEDEWGGGGGLIITSLMLSDLQATLLVMGWRGMKRGGASEWVNSSLPLQVMTLVMG